MPSPSTIIGNKHFYMVNGRPLWSVTTILDVIQSPAFSIASARYAAAYFADNLDVLAEMTAKTPEGRDEAVLLAAGAFGRHKEERANIGSEVHRAIEAINLGLVVPTVSEITAPYVGQFRAFLDDYQPNIEAAEMTVANLEQAYAGTLDLIVYFPEIGYVIVDVKTSKCRKNAKGECVGVWPDPALQLAAYRHAPLAVINETTTYAMPSISAGAILHLAPDHYRFVEVDCGPEVFRSFLYVRESYRWVHETSKTVVRGPFVVPEKEGTLCR